MRSWLDLTFFKRTFLFYLVIWIGSGVAAVWAISLWFRPSETLLFSGNLLLMATYVVMIQRMGARRFAYRLAKGARIIIRRVAALVEHDMGRSVSTTPHRHA